MVKNTSILLCGCGSGIRNIFDPGSGMENFGSGVNIRTCNTGLKKLKTDIDRKRNNAVEFNANFSQMVIIGLTEPQSS
jgi:hypothetical protein